MQAGKYAAYQCKCIFVFVQVMVISALSGIVTGVRAQLSAKFSLLPSIPATGNTILPNTAHSATGSTAPSAGSMAHSQPVSSGTQVVVPAGMFLGEGLVPLPAKLVQCTICLEFVEMVELLLESWLAAESSDAEVSGHAKVVSIFPKWRRLL